MSCLHAQISADFVKQTLSEEQAHNLELKKKQDHLLRKQEALQEELLMALNNYTPKAHIYAGQCGCVWVCLHVCR